MLEGLRNAANWVSTQSAKAYDSVKHFVKDEPSVGSIEPEKAKSVTRTFEDLKNLVKEHYNLNDRKVSKELVAGTTLISLSQILNLPSALISRTFSKHPKVGRWSATLLPTSWIGMGCAYAGEKCLTRSGSLRKVNETTPTLERVYNLSHLIYSRYVPLQVSREDVSSLLNSRVSSTSSRNSSEYGTELEDDVLDEEQVKDQLELIQSIEYKHPYDERDESVDIINNYLIAVKNRLKDQVRQGYDQTQFINQYKAWVDIANEGQAAQLLEHAKAYNAKLRKTTVAPPLINKPETAPPDLKPTVIKYSTVAREEIETFKTTKQNDTVFEVPHEVDLTGDDLIIRYTTLLTEAMVQKVTVRYPPKSPDLDYALSIVEDTVYPLLREGASKEQILDAIANTV